MSLQLKPRHSVRAKISAVGAYVPPRLLTNADLEKMVATNDEWITERTGIRERHIVEPGTPTSDLAVEAARACLARRGIAATEVEAILVATVTPDMLFPATACIVQDKLGATGAWGFDLSAACSGFLYALQMGAKLVESGAHKYVLVIGADVMSSIIDYTDRSTCILFGDGAGCVLLEPCVGDEVGLIDFVHEVDGSGACSLQMPAGGSLHPATHETVDAKQHFVHQDGGAVYKIAVRKMAELSEKVLQRNDITGADLDCFIPHQANRRIIEATADRLLLVSDGKVTPFEGDLDDYRRFLLTGDNAPTRRVEEDVAPPAPKISKEDERRNAATKRAELKPLKDKITAAEHQIATMTAELAKLDKVLSDPLLFSKDPAKATSVSKKRADAARKLEAAEKSWVSASEAYENANA